MALEISNRELEKGNSAVCHDHEQEKSGSSSDKTPAESINAQEPTVDKLPSRVWIVAMAGAAERFCYYCLSTPLQNYIQNNRDSVAVPGGLGLGQQTATNMTNAMLLIMFITPALWATLADMRLGRFKTLLAALGVYQLGTLILFVSSLPVALDAGAGLPGLAVAMLCVALGVAGVKSSFSPFLIDQYGRTESRLLKSENGVDRVSDRGLTVQFITNMFYWITNVASLSSVPSTFMEKKIDFWASNLMAFISLWITTFVLYAYRDRFLMAEVQGSVLPLTAKALWCAIRHRCSLTAATPEAQRDKYHTVVSWDSTVVEDLRSTLLVVRVLICSFPFYLAAIQVTNNLISQAAQMRLEGMPNDLMPIWNPIACVIVGVLVQQGLFPFLRRRGISFGPISRLSTACLLMGAAMAYAAGLQSLIYSRGPCYSYPLACPEAIVTVPGGNDSSTTTSISLGNDITVWTQMPVWILLATAEVLGFATIMEIAYENAPTGMRSVVQAATQVTAGMAAVVGIALTPITRDPTLVIMYAVVAGLGGAAVFPLWYFNRALEDKKRKNDFRRPQPGREEERNEAV